MNIYEIATKFQYFCGLWADGVHVSFNVDSLIDVHIWYPLSPVLV
jgi:hypothetical protein